jgi:3-oxoadipate enol-lactonase
MSPSAERRELARPDATIRYWVSGPARAPRVVLLHGATLDHRAWDAQVDALRRHYRVVVPDLRGHGESTLTERFRFADALADVAALLDVLDAERPGTPTALVGLSLGGNLAQALVQRAPDRVGALVVADATCNTATRHPFAAPMTIASLAALSMSSHELFVRHAAEMTSLREDVRRYVTGTNAGRTNAETLQILSELLQGGLHADPAYRLPVPTLLLHGDADRMGDVVDSMRTWAARDGRAEYVVVRGAGHASNQDNPAAFNAALLAFLGRVHAPAESSAPHGATSVRPAPRRLADLLRKAVPVASRRALRR